MDHSIVRPSRAIDKKWPGPGSVFLLAALLAIVGCTPTAPVPGGVAPTPTLAAARTGRLVLPVTSEPAATPTGTATASPSPSVQASPSPEPTVTHSPTPGQTPTPAPTATWTPEPSASAYFSDDFSDPDSGWPTGPSPDGQAGHEYRDGAYEVWTNTGVTVAPWWLSRRVVEPLADLEVEVEARQAGRDGELAYGLVFRAQSENESAYVFMVSTVGAFTLGRRSGQDWVPLLDWTPSPAIRGGDQANHLMVVANGRRLAGFVNDQLVVVLEDGALGEGAVGLLVANFSRGEKAHVLFDDFSVRQPDAASLARLQAVSSVPPITRPPSPRILDPIPTALPIADEPLRIAHGATIHLVADGPDGMARSGTGTVVGPDGRTAVTAFHVVGDPATGELYADVLKVGPFLDWRLTAHVLDTAPELDLAVIRIDAQDEFQGFAIVPMGDSDALDVGDTIYTLSYPGSGQGSLITTSGVVLGTYRDGLRSPIRFILTDAQASPGSSGGVAINREGELVGIVTALVLRADVLANLGYPNLKQATVLIPVNLARSLVETARD